MAMVVPACQPSPGTPCSAREGAEGKMLSQMLEIYWEVPKELQGVRNQLIS